MSTRQKPAASPATSSRRAPALGSAAHEVRVIDGQFAHAVCTCGWRSAGRRLRATARTEGRDHVLLYAQADVRDADVRDTPRA